MKTEIRKSQPAGTIDSWCEKCQQIHRPVNQALRLTKTYTKGVEETEPNALVTRAEDLPMMKPIQRQM